MIVQLRKKEISLGRKSRWAGESRSGRSGGGGGGGANWELGTGRASRWDLDSYRFDETINNAIHGEC